MILSFDKFERYELPQVTLCNPNSRAIEVDGKITITDTVGVLSNPSGMNLKLNFNAPHELSFDYCRHKSTDPIKQSFYDSIYEAIQTDRHIYLTDIGYFIISSVTDSDEDNIDRKSISLKSCEENELTTAEGLYIEEGTYYLHTDNNDGLLDLFFPKTAGWTIGFIDPSLLTKPYYVEDTEVDNGYNFLYTTIQDMFECIVEPDIIKRTIGVYSRVYYAEHHLTDIHIAKYNLLKHKTVEENDEDKYTALNVQGKDENLEIRAVNPTGKNVIYNFEPRYSWMPPALQQAIEKWQEKCESVEDEYLTLQQGYYAELENLFNEEQDIEVLKGELKTLEETRDAALTMVAGDERDTSVKNVNDAITAKQTEINTATSNYNAHKATVQTTYEEPISQINADCALNITAIDINGNSIFTTDLLNELMNHIKPTDYIDEYMLVTESMTYPQRFEKAKELMDRAQSQLVKISSGQKTYSIDTRSFLFNKQFKHFSEQLCAGAIIYVETKNDTMEQLHLTGIDINFDDKSTNFTLGNKYDRSDLKALYEDALGQNSKSFSELKYIASIIEDQQKQLDYQKNWVADLRTLTLDNVLTSEDQAIEINNRGLIGRKRQLNADGSWKDDENGNPLFYAEQVKLINNTLIFTEDNWNTASTAVGKIAVGYDAKGNVKYSYGVNGQVLIGELILGNNLVLTGTGAGIKIKDKNGNNAFYADENGNLVLSGTIFANSGKIGGWSINGFKIYAGDGKDVKTSVIQAPSSDITWVFAAGGKSHDSYSDCPFRVDKYGNLYATSGKIAGWTIGAKTLKGPVYNETEKQWYGVGLGTQNLGGSGNCLAIGKMPNETMDSWGGAAFRVTGVGKLYATGADIEGKITASSGEIGSWHIASNYLWTKTSTNNGVGMGVSSVANGGLAFYAGFSGTDNPWADNSSWTEKTQFYVTNTGHVVCKNITATGGAIAGWTVDGNSIRTGTLGSAGSMWLCRNGTSTSAAIGSSNSRDKWCIAIDKNFGVTNTGLMYATAAHFSGGITLESGGFNVGNFVLSSSGLTLSNGIDVTLGYVYNQIFYMQPAQLRVTLKPVTSGASSYDVSAKWFDIAKAGEEYRNNVSDSRLKKDISSFTPEYEILFDNLKPKSYKYIDGTSGRTHTGFIAQDIVKALENAGLETEDFAGACFEFGDEKYGYWYLRRDEFVALNTWQIQKLKSRVDTLENTVAELKTQIQTLAAG